VSQTLAGVRNKYWIPHGRTAVRLTVKACNVCRRFKGSPYKMPSIQKMTDNKSRPFSYTGLDYMGPLLIKSYVGSKKNMNMFIYMSFYESNSFLNSLRYDNRRILNVYLTIHIAKRNTSTDN
jgi:hypothetical protein